MSEERHTEFVMRTINAEKDGESRTILQFHYVSWPDHGIPSSTRPMLDMIALVREYQPGHDPPIVVHCRSVFWPKLIKQTFGFPSKSSVLCR